MITLSMLQVEGLIHWTSSTLAASGLTKAAQAQHASSNKQLMADLQSAQNGPITTINTTMLIPIPALGNIVQKE